MAVLIDEDTGLPYLVKRPAPESRLYKVNFSKFLNAITGTPEIEVQPRGLVTETDVLLATTIGSTGTEVTFRLTNGTDQEDYELKFKVADDASNIISEDMLIKVRIAGLIA